MDLQNFNLTEWVQTMLILVIAITIHEFAHAFVTDRCGDNTPRLQGRLSLNPMDHLDPLGTFMMALSSATGFGIGWGKPVQYHPVALRHPRWDPLKIAIAGPISNILQALVFAALVRLCDRQDWLLDTPQGYHLLEMGVWVNLTPAFFNMIPIPPLDGSKILSAILPIHHAHRYDQVMQTWGLLFFFAIALTPAASYIIGPPVTAVYHFLIG